MSIDLPLAADQALEIGVCAHLPATISSVPFGLTHYPSVITII